MASDHKTGCLICGEDLEYTKEPALLECFYCKQEFDSNNKCKNGHYVCDQCHSASAVDLIQKYCISCKSEDPLACAGSDAKS